MEKIGKINDAIGLFGNFWNAHALVQQTKEHSLLRENTNELLSFFKEVKQSGSLTSILDIEEVALRMEMEFHGNSQEEHSSLKEAMRQFGEAKISLSAISDHEAYKIGTSTYPKQNRDGKGLPIDGFRNFIKSHTTRISNILKAPLPVSEKNLLRQRKENLNQANSIYLEMQYQALGMTSHKELNNEIER